MARRSRLDLTKGSLATKLVSLAGPLVAGNILQTVYNLVDMFWVGRLGADAVAAVSIVFPTAWLLISIAMGVTIAGAALVSQWYGADEPEQANFAAGQTVVLAAIVSTVLATIAFLGRFQLLRLLGATGALYEPTLDYVSVIFWSVPFTFLFFSFRAVLRGAGDTMRPMYLVIASNIVNMVLDPLLILGIGPFPFLGVEGAAWATLISRGLAGIVGIVWLFSGTLDITLRLSQMKPHLPTLTQLLRVGIPGGVDGAARSFSAVAMIAIVTRFGPVPTAAFGIGIRVMSLVWTISGAMGQAVATGVGQNLGANLIGRSKRVAWVGTFYTFVAIGAAGIVAMLYAPQIVRVFVADPEVIAEGARFLRISGWGFGAAGALMVIQGAFHGAGRTNYSMILSLFNRWLLRMPFAMVLGWTFNWGAVAVWWSFLISDISGLAIGAAWLQWGKWEQRLVSDGPEADAAEVAPAKTGVRPVARESGTD